MFPGQGGLAALERGVLFGMAEGPLWRPSVPLSEGSLGRSCWILAGWGGNTPLQMVGEKRECCLFWCVLSLASSYREPCLGISTGKISQRNCVLQDRKKDTLLFNIHRIAGPRSLSQPQDSLVLTFIQTLFVLYPIYLLTVLLAAF